MSNIKSMIDIARDMISCARSSTSSTVPDALCNDLKNELNAFFSGYKNPKCTEVVITQNIDKPMFGIMVFPETHSGDRFMDKIIGGIDEECSDLYGRYSVDIDAKMLVMLNAPELCAMIINDINELFTRNTLCTVSNAINAVVAFNNTTIDRESMADTIFLLRFVVGVTMHNVSSCLPLLQTPDGKFTQNAFSSALLSEYGLYEHLLSGINAVKSNGTYWNALAVYNPAVLLNWYFAHYKDSNWQIISDTLQEALKMESSTIIRRQLMVAIKSTTTIPAEARRYYVSLTEAASKQKKGLIGQMKRNGLKSLEEDLYEYSMRLRNVDTQDDAILLMRQLNSRISILDDYLTYEEMSESERSRWQAVYDEYQKIRGELTKKTVYNRKMYGLFVDYNALADMSRSQQQQILQSYY